MHRRHFVYVSLAQPAPVMRAYIAVRQRGERLIRDAIEHPPAGVRIVEVPEIAAMPLVPAIASLR